MSDTCSCLPLPEVPPLSPTYPEDTDKGIELGFQGSPWLCFIKKRTMGAGETAQMIRALVALAEDTGLVLSIHMAPRTGL